MKKVFGIGFSKTGTTTLENVLRTLGYNPCRAHWQERYNDFLLSLYVNKDFNQLKRMTRHWNAFADGPWGGGDLYRELYKWYPDAKYILTIRDPEKWFNSLYNMIMRRARSGETALNDYGCWAYGSEYFFRHIFGITELKGNKEKIINYYTKTNSAIESFFRGKDNFLKIDLTDPSQKNKWKPLCEFLEKPLPKCGFPHSNKRKK